MQPTQDPSSGSLTGAPLWTLTAVVILVAGLLFYFVSQPLAEAFDALMPAPQEPVPVVEQPPPPPPPPEQPPPPPPRVWTADEIEAGMAELATTLGPLIEAGAAELPTYSELGATPTAAAGESEGDEGFDQASVQRAAARWARWGVIWRNRVDAERDKLPPQPQCVGHQGLQAGCVELHDILEDIEAVADAGTYDDAAERMEAAATRLDVYLEPPPEEPSEEEDEDEDEDSSLDVAEPAQ